MFTGRMTLGRSLLRGFFLVAPGIRGRRWEFKGMANYRQERWKAPLPEYIEHLYLKQFRRAVPKDIRSIEIKEAEKRQKKPILKGVREKNS